jgi:uncharacterized protein (DUF2267 family)/CBS domain-containing protein
VVKLVARSPVYVPPEAALVSIAQVMAEESIGTVLVRGPHRPSGIVSERDVVCALAEGADARRLPARDVMSPDVVYASSTDTIRDVGRRLLEHGIRHLAVNRGDTIIGVVSMRDVLAVYSDEPDHDGAGDDGASSASSGVPVLPEHDAPRFDDAGDRPRGSTTLVTHVDASAIPKTVEKTREWVAAVSGSLGGDDPQRAWLALRAVLHGVRDRLPVEILGHFSAQLPMLIRGLLFEGWDPTGKPERWGRDEFVAHVRREANLDTAAEAETAIRAVIEVLWGRLAEGVMEHVAAVLPADYAGLLY